MKRPPHFPNFLRDVILFQSADGVDIFFGCLIWFTTMGCFVALVLSLIK